MLPPGATSGPKRSLRAATTSGLSYSSWTTSSLEITSAPSSRSAPSAVDLPAPIPPVSPTNGTAALTAATAGGTLSGRAVF